MKAFYLGIAMMALALALIYKGPGRQQAAYASQDVEAQEPVQSTRRRNCPPRRQYQQSRIQEAEWEPTGRTQDYQDDGATTTIYRGAER